MPTFTGKVAVVTGAGSGIGRSLVLNLAKQGAKLAISDVDTEGLQTTEEKVRALGAEVISQRLDVTDRAAVLSYADTVKAHYGTVNLVVNNAGIAFTGDINDMTFEQIEKVVDVDFWGVVNGSKAFLPHLIASGDGRLVNISSLFGLLAIPGQGAYNAAKFATRGFTEALRQEMLVAKLPVKVTCVHPGGIKTAIARNAGAVDGHDQAELAKYFDKKLAMTSADKAASVILGASAKGKARVLVGPDAKALDLLVRITGSGYQRIVSFVSAKQVPQRKTSTEIGLK